MRRREPPLLMTIEEAADFLGVKRSRLYEDVKAGRWAACVVRYGSEVRLSRLALLEFLKAPTTSQPAASEVP